MSDSFDVIVVGAGFGGATCAALLAKRGLRTLLVDKNAIPGGKAMTVGEKGFRYDLWPIVGGPSLNSRFAEVLDELEMADQVEILTPEQSNVLMYRGATGEYASFVGSAVPNPEGAGAALQLLGLSGEDLPEVLRLFGDIGAGHPGADPRARRRDVQRVPLPLSPAAVAGELSRHAGQHHLRRAHRPAGRLGDDPGAPGLRRGWRRALPPRWLRTHGRGVLPGASSATGGVSCSARGSSGSRQRPER